MALLPLSSPLLLFLPHPQLTKAEKKAAAAAAKMQAAADKKQAALDKKQAVADAKEAKKQAALRVRTDLPTVQ